MVVRLVTKVGMLWWIMHPSSQLQSGVFIMQKYQVSGYTQIECDSMHNIESRILPVIFSQKPAPYIVLQLAHDEWIKLAGMYFNGIRPGKKTRQSTIFENLSTTAMARFIARYLLIIMWSRRFCHKGFKPQQPHSQRGMLCPLSTSFTTVY